MRWGAWHAVQKFSIKESNLSRSSIPEAREIFEEDDDGVENDD